MALSGMADGKSKTELSLVLDDLIKGADAAEPDQQQLWVDSHLGELNAAIRTMGDDAPKELTVMAAARASGLNNQAERWKEGRELADIALNYDPTDRDALIGRSQASSALADFSRGYADADAVVRRAPDVSAGWTARAAASYGLGNYLQAIEDARRALALDPNNATAHALMRLSEGRTAASPKFDNTSLAQSIEREYHGMV